MYDKRGLCYFGKNTGSKILIFMILCIYLNIKYMLVYMLIKLILMKKKVWRKAYQ